MTYSITAALLAAGSLGLSFSNTRSMAIAAIAALTFVYPWLALLVLPLAGAFIYLQASK